MTTDLAQLEAELLESLEQRERHFATALQLTESLSSCLEAGDFGQSTLTELNTVLESVSGMEQRAAGIHSQWKQQGGTPGPELTKRIQDVSAQIEELMRRFAQAEQSASAARERLKPQISQEVSSRRMLNAYQKS